MVTLQGAVVAHPEGVAQILRGWAVEPLSSVCCVVLDDGRQLLIAHGDLGFGEEPEEAAPDTDPNPETWQVAS